MEEGRSLEHQRVLSTYREPRHAGPFQGSRLILSSSHPLPSGSGPRFIDKALRGEDVIYPGACSQDLKPGFSTPKFMLLPRGRSVIWQHLYPLGWRRNGLAGREVWPWGPVSPGSLSSPTAAAPGLASLCMREPQSLSTDIFA